MEYRRLSSYHFEIKEKTLSVTRRYCIGALTRKTPI